MNYRPLNSALCVQRLLPCRVIACALAVAALLLSEGTVAHAFDIHFDYTSFDNANTPGANPHFGQAQFNVLNYPSINGNFMMTSTDNHRPEMVANGNDLAQFYNNFLADYNTQAQSNTIDAAAEADKINQYSLLNSAKNGPRPTWLVLNEISASLWPVNPGAPNLSTYRQWVVDCVTRLNDVYGFKIVTFAPFATVGTGNPNNGASWQALTEKSYIGVENYLSGAEVMAGGSDYATRVAWAESQYQASKTTYTAVGVDESRLFLGEHFGNNTAANGWGRAGLSATDWDTVIQIRQDAIYNTGFAGFLAYSWGSNPLGITEAEQIQHEYYYRSRLVLPTQKPQWLSDSAINVNGTTIPLSWSQPLNWLGGVPDASGAEANFWRTLTTGRTITLDGNKTIGSLLFDSAFSYTISPGTGGSLILNNSGSAATITSNQGTHSVNVDVQLSSNVSAAVNAGGVTIGGVVSGAGSLTKTGAGVLALTATNSYAGDTIVQVGKLSLGSGSLADTADVYVANGALLELNFTGILDVVDSLFLNGVSQATGIWGAIGSGAQFTSSLLLGTGKLQVTTFIPLPVVGDYNQDGIVDAADYTTWRDNIGAASLPNRDSNNTGAVGQADYTTWRTHFGQTAGSGASVGLSASAAVPEPAVSALLLVWALMLLVGRRTVLR